MYPGYCGTAEVCPLLQNAALEIVICPEGF
jgi:hypothetical protein